VVKHSLDKKDVILSQLLLANSRLPYRDLADKLGLSVNAAHKRIQALIESGIIRAFTAKISLSALKAFGVLIYGRSETQSIDEACQKLGQHDLTYWVGVGGGNYLYIGACLQSISELEPYVDYVKKEARMLDPTVGLNPPEASPSSPATPRNTILHPLDYQIIYALHNNSRRSISEVSEELGVSARTARRRLSRMVHDGLIQLSIDWYPDASNDIGALFHLRLKPSADRNKVGSMLASKYAPNVVFFWLFSNLPNQMICVVWTSTMKELRDLRKSLERKGFFESIIPDILYAGYIFDTWRDKLLQEKGRPPTKQSAE
jgi:DNA-binding Lrp family transcriptional regulator